MACLRCHEKKIKCSGGDSDSNVACRHCHSARVACIFPARNRNVTISEGYLRALERTVAQLTTSQSAPAQDAPSTSTTLETHRGDNHSSSKRRFIENTTGDSFVVQLKSLGKNDTSTMWIGRSDESATGSITQGQRQDSVPPYKYFVLPSDHSVTHKTLKLPPYPYAIQLINQFEAYMGFEYHWYLRKSFRERLESTYEDPYAEESKDHTWLCRLLVVLALGETYNSRVAPWIELGGDSTLHPNRRNSNSTRPPPGIEFFEDAMSLFETPFEEVTIDHVEVLNLITVYSYSLGRRRSAYMYSGIATRIVSTLMLDIPSNSNTLSPRDLEHRKRLWWTTYQLDAMTGSELGLNSTYDFEEIESKLGLPSDENLSTLEQDEFVPCAILIAHIRLCSVRAGILSTASTKLLDADFEQLTTIIGPPMTVLEDWKKRLPETINFECSGGIPPQMVEMSECRSLSSVYIRFHQCFILLLRPILLRFLASAITEGPTETERLEIVNSCNHCVNMARRNLSILNGLRELDKIAKFGFWESLHLFSSIKVFLMASIISAIRPFAIVYNDPDDHVLYENSRALLREMSSAGNMSSRSHLNLLRDLEQTRELIIGRIHSNPADCMEIPDPDVDIDQWLAMLNASPNTSMIPTW